MPRSPLTGGESVTESGGGYGPDGSGGHTIPGLGFDAESYTQAFHRFRDEARSLRSGAGVPDSNDPRELLVALRDVRGRADRVEAMIAEVAAARTAVRSRLDVVRAHADDTWNRAATQRNRSGVREDYTSAKERHADYDLSALAERHEFRLVQSCHDTASESLDVMRATHRGLESVRSDIHVIVKTLPLLSQLET